MHCHTGKAGHQRWLQEHQVVPRVGKRKQDQQQLRQRLQVLPAHVQPEHCFSEARDPLPPRLAFNSTLFVLRCAQ